MARIKLAVEKIDDIDESVRSFVVEDGGAFHFDSEKLPDAAGLTSALDKERKERKKLADSLKVWDGLDPETVKGLVAKKDEIERNAKLQEGKINEVVQGLQKGFDDERKAWNADREKYTAENNQLKGTIKRSTIERALESEFIANKGRPEYLDDVKLRADQFGVFDGKVYALDEDGESPKRHPTEGLRHYEPKDFMADMAKAKPGWFGESGGGGAGGGTQRRQGQGIVSRDDPQSILQNIDKLASGEATLG